MNLIPIPSRPNLQVPSGDDVKELKAVLEILVKDYNRLYAILLQDVNRLSTPAAATPDVSADVQEQGYVIALLASNFSFGPGATIPPAVVYNPNRLVSFLRKWAFVQ